MMSLDVPASAICRMDSQSSSLSTFAVSAAAAGGAQRSTAKPYPLKALKGYINGKWVDAQSGNTIAVPNPADGTAVAHVSDMGRADTEAAIAAATAAFPAWAAKTAFERAAIVRKMWQLMMDNIEGIAVLLTAETGKPLEEAKGEVRSSASYHQHAGFGNSGWLASAGTAASAASHRHQKTHDKHPLTMDIACTLILP